MSKRKMFPATPATVEMLRQQLVQANREIAYHIQDVAPLRAEVTHLKGKIGDLLRAEKAVKDAQLGAFRSEFGRHAPGKIRIRVPCGSRYITSKQAAKLHGA